MASQETPAAAGEPADAADRISGRGAPLDLDSGYFGQLTSSLSAAPPLPTFSILIQLIE
jgi:hypothetical protein